MNPLQSAAQMQDKLPTIPYQQPPSEPPDYAAEVLAGIDRRAAGLTPLRMIGLLLGIVAAAGLIVAAIMLSSWLSRSDRMIGGGLWGAITGMLWLVDFLTLCVSAIALVRMTLILTARLKRAPPPKYPSPPPSANHSANR